VIWSSSVDSAPGSKEIRSLDLVFGAAFGRRTTGPVSATRGQLLLQPTGMQMLDDGSGRRGGESGYAGLPSSWCLEASCRVSLDTTRFGLRRAANMITVRGERRGSMYITLHQNSDGYSYQGAFAPPKPRIDFQSTGGRPKTLACETGYARFATTTRPLVPRAN